MVRSLTLFFIASSDLLIISPDIRRRHRSSIRSCLAISPQVSFEVRISHLLCLFIFLSPLDLNQITVTFRKCHRRIACEKICRIIKLYINYSTLQFLISAKLTIYFLYVLQIVFSHSGVLISSYSLTWTHSVTFKDIFIKFIFYSK